MALYFDPPGSAFSSNMLALGFITNFQGEYVVTPDTIDGFPVSKVQYQSNSTSFGPTRIKAISNVLPDVIVLSAQNSDFVLPGGTPITAVAGAVLLDSFGQILVWDQGNCNGQGYHVFDTAGGPIEQETYLTVFHELSHAYHNALGSSPADLVASELLAIQETNLLRSQLGLPLRDPTNHGGGCGPGPSEPWWKKFLSELVESLGVFLGGGSAPAGVPKLKSAEGLLRAELTASSAAFDQGADRWKESLQQPVVAGLRCFYKAAAMVLDRSLDHPQQAKRMIAILSELSRKDVHRRAANLLLPRRVGPTSGADGSALELFASEPYQMIWRAYDQLFGNGKAVSEVTRSFKRAVESWTASLRPSERELPERPQRSTLLNVPTLVHRTFP